MKSANYGRLIAFVFSISFAGTGSAQDVGITSNGPSHGIPACGSASFTVSGPTPVIRFSIPDDLSTIGGHKLVETPIDSNGKAAPFNEDDDAPTTDIPAPNPTTDPYDRNPFHLKLSKVPDPGVPFSFYEIRLTLRGSLLSFGTLSSSADTGNVPVYGVGVGKPDAGKAGFCFSGIYKAGDTIPGILPAKTFNHPVVVLYVTHGSGSKLETGLNILLTPAGAAETPIVIDPKIENNG